MNFINGENKKDLRRAIVSTVAFFDLFDFPLTSFELWKFLPLKAVLPEVMECAEKELIGVIASKNGAYFLQGREELFEIRRRRYKVAEHKHKKALLAARIFSILPWVRMIAIGNVIGPNNFKKESDIDLFLITEKNRIWISRFFTALAAKMLGWRPKEGNVRDKICLSFFISEENMDLARFKLGGHSSAGGAPGAAEIRETAAAAIFSEDIYLPYWLANLIVISDKDGCSRDFFKSNAWIRECLPNFDPIDFKYKRDIKPNAAIKFYEKTADLLCGWMEKPLKYVQLKIMPPSLLQAAGKGTGVIIDDTALKFHVNDRRDEIRRKYLKKMEKALLVLDGIERKEVGHKAEIIEK